MRDRHWQNLSEQLHVPLTADKDFVLSKALDLGLMSQLDIIQKVKHLTGKDTGCQCAFCAA